jgi:WD40-like Beta Propeller Repeat
LRKDREERYQVIKDLLLDLKGVRQELELIGVSRLLSGLISTVELPMVVRWTRDGRAVTYIDTRNGVSNLWLQPITGGPARQITNWTEQQIFSFAWSRDGKRIIAARGSRKDDVVLIKDAR